MKSFFSFAQSIQESLNDLHSQLGDSAAPDAFDTGYCKKQADSSVSYAADIAVLVLFVIFSVAFLTLAAFTAVLVYYHVKNVHVP